MKVPGFHTHFIPPQDTLQALFCPCARLFCAVEAHDLADCMSCLGQLGVQLQGRGSLHDVG